MGQIGRGFAPLVAISVLVAACAAPPPPVPTAAPTSPPAATATSAPAPTAAAKPTSSGAAAPAVTTAPAAPPKPTGAPAQPASVTAGYSNTSGDVSAVWVAEDGGYFQKHGLDAHVQLVSGGPQSLSALLSGQTQIGHLGGAEVLSATAEGADLVVVGTLTPVYPYLLYVPADIKSPADLKGKKLDATNFGGSVDIANRVGLPRIGLNPDTDVSFIASGSHANGTAALLNGAIQGRMDNPPASQELEAHGFHVLEDLAKEKLPAANTTIVVSRSYLNDHRAVVQQYVDALIESIARMEQDKAFTVGVYKKYFKSDDDAAMQATYDFFVGEVIPAQPFPRPEQFADAVQQLSQKNAKVRDVDLSKLLDPSLVQSAVDRGLAGPGH